MAFNLTGRMNMRGAGRFDAEEGGGWRGNTADFGSEASSGERGGFASPQSDDGVHSSALPGHPHSSYGFRRALRQTQRKSSGLVDSMNQRNFSMRGANKPNYFAQGAHRHGMHIGAGSPATIPASEEGFDS
jgi:hypothetical protein